MRESILRVAAEANRKALDAWSKSLRLCERKVAFRFEDCAEAIFRMRPCACFKIKSINWHAQTLALPKSKKTKKGFQEPELAGQRHSIKIPEGGKHAWNVTA